MQFSCWFGHCVGSEKLVKDIKILFLNPAGCFVGLVKLKFPSSAAGNMAHQHHKLSLPLTYQYFNPKHFTWFCSCQAEGTHLNFKIFNPTAILHTNLMNLLSPLCKTNWMIAAKLELLQIYCIRGYGNHIIDPYCTVLHTVGAVCPRWRSYAELLVGTWAEEDGFWWREAVIGRCEVTLLFINV